MGQPMPPDLLRSTMRTPVATRDARRRPASPVGDKARWARGLRFQVRHDASASAQGVRVTARQKGSQPANTSTKAVRRVSQTSPVSGAAKAHAPPKTATTGNSPQPYNVGQAGSVCACISTADSVSTASLYLTSRRLKTSFWTLLAWFHMHVDAINLRQRLQFDAHGIGDAMRLEE